MTAHQKEMYSLIKDKTVPRSNKAYWDERTTACKDCGADVIYDDTGEINGHKNYCCMVSLTHSENM